MNIRQKHILNTLILDHTIDLSEVAEKFAVGIRAIRYDLDIINEYIDTKLHMNAIEIKRGKAFLLLNARAVERLHMNDLAADFYEIKITPEDRVILMLYDLCWASDLITIQELADRYYVSRATVNSDFIVIKKWCKDNGIQLVSVKGKGIYINANEAERREYLTKIIRNLKNQKYSQDFILSEWFKDINIELIEEIITDAEKEYELWLTEISFEGLIIHICLAIKRYQEDVIYDMNIMSIPVNIESLHYEMAKKIVTEIKLQYPLALPDSEIAYVAIHLEGKSGYIIEQEPSDDAFIKLYALNMISYIGNQLHLNFHGDKKLLDGLNQHLRASYFRYRNGMEERNPLKEELITNYPHLYELLKTFIHNIDMQPIIKGNDDEITYVLLHFAAAENRQRKASKRVANVIVVCATGVGTSELVASALNMHFKLNIKAKIARHHLAYYLHLYHVDFIITTVFIDTAIPTVQVHPILEQTDINKIRATLYDLGLSAVAQPQNVYADQTYMDEFIGIMDTYEQRKNKGELLYEIINLYNKMKNEQTCFTKVDGDNKMLSEVLNEKNIDLHVDCQSWEEAIVACGRLLLREDYISEQYIQASIDSVKEHGPYIVITKGVALAHASNSYGVLKTGMAFIRLQHGVEFGNLHNDPVTCVFMLATTDANSHLLALSDLAEMLEQDAFKALLNHAPDISEIMDYIKENESKA